MRCTPKFNELFLCLRTPAASVLRALLLTGRVRAQGAVQPSRAEFSTLASSLALVRGFNPVHLSLSFWSLEQLNHRTETKHMLQMSFSFKGLHRL